MDPIDFTRPEAFSQAGTGALRDAQGLNQPGPAPNSDDALRLRRTLRSLVFWVVLAPLSWLALAVMLAVTGTAESQAIDLSVSMFEPSFVARLRLLAWMTADTLFWPVIVVAAFLLLRGLLGEFLIRRMLASRAAAASDEARSVTQLGGGAVQDGPDEVDGLRRICTLGLGIVRIVPLTVAALGAIWATMAAVALANDADPWEALPWVTPPYQEVFLARHPGLVLERAGSGGKLRLSDRQGRSISLHGSELVGAQLSLASCPADMRAEQLGGIPPYPGIPCVTLAQIRDVDGIKLHYVFEIASGSNSAAVFAHFSRWSDEHASGSGSSISKGHHTLSATSRDDKWHIEMNSSQGGATSIVIRRSP